MTKQQPSTVRDTQNRLNALGYNAGDADGVAGSKTDAAVRAFQAANGLTVDGIAGPQTLAAMAKADPAPAPSAPPARSFTERQSDIDSLATASPAAAQAMRQELVADVENRVGEIDNQLRNLPTNSFSGYVRPALQAEQDEIKQLLPKPASSNGSDRSFTEQQSDIDSIVTASPAAAQKMQEGLNAEVTDARVRAAALDDQLQNLPTDSFSGYVRPALQAELDGIKAQLEDYDRLTGKGDSGLAAPGETYAEAPSNFEQVLDPLNSAGDEIKVDLSAEVGVTGKIYHGAVEGGLSASVEQTEDGFVIKVDREAALRLGLDVDGKKGGEGADAKATAGIGGGHLIKYEFDTREEAAEALKDLVITAGDDPRAGFAAAGVENAADIAHGAAGIYDSFSDKLLSIGTFGRYDNNPAGDLLEIGTGFVEEKTNEGRDAIDAARARLNAARNGEEFSVSLELGANGTIKGDDAASKLGLPAGLNADDLGLELGGSGSGEAELTFSVDRDGNISTSVALSQSANTTSKGGGVEVKTNGQASIEYELAFEKDDDGRLVRQSSGDITINFSAGVDTSAGSGIEATTSAGGGFSYTIKADDLNDHAREAVQQALDGDQRNALQTLVSVPGELELNVDVGAGARIDGEIDLKHVTISGGIERNYATEATFTVDAENGLNGDALAAAKSIVNGDIDEGLEIIGNVEGDLSVQNQRATSGELGFEVDTKVVDVDVTGTATATDKDNALNVEGVTLRDGVLIAAAETRDFAAEEAGAVSDDIEFVHAEAEDFIADRLSGG